MDVKQNISYFSYIDILNGSLKRKAEQINNIFFFYEKNSFMF